MKITIIGILASIAIAGSFWCGRDWERKSTIHALLMEQAEHARASATQQNAYESCINTIVRVGLINAQHRKGN